MIERAAIVAVWLLQVVGIAAVFAVLALWIMGMTV